MPTTQLRPRAPRLRRVAGLALTGIVLTLAVTVRLVTPIHAAAAPAVPSTPTVEVPTPVPSPVAAPTFPRTPVDPAAIADSMVSRRVVQPARLATPTAEAGPVLDLPTYANAVFVAVVPARWRTAVPARFSVVDGSTSMSYTDGEIEVAASHLTGSTELAKTSVAHEWGHQLAYRYGSHAYLGAAPSGWPYVGARPEEAWADCVAAALLGYAMPSHGLAPCTGDALAFTQQFLASGP